MGLVPVLPPTVRSTAGCNANTLPTRLLPPGRYYQSSISTPSAPVDIAPSPGYRYLLEAGSTTALASKARALAVPPSQLTPDMRGAGPGSLAVEVLNTLGQRVCTGPACAEASSDCPVEGCPPGYSRRAGRLF